MRFNLLWMLTAICAIAGPPLAAPKNAEAATIQHVLRFASAEEISNLNPDLSAQLVVAYLSQMTAAYLFRLDHDNRLTPELATEIPTLANGGISKDGLTITIHLRKGVKWSDGAPFDADDFVFTIAAIDNTANLIPSRTGFDQISHVDEPDKATVIVHLRSPYGAIVPTLFASNGALALLPKHILGSLHDMNDAPFNALPVGIGPFRYAAWKRGDAVELERNPNYWRGAPALERVIMKLIPDRNSILTQLQTGELDMWFPFGGAFLARVQAIPDVYIIRHPGYTLNKLLINVKSPAVSERAVRTALRLATDRVAIRDKIGHGVGVIQDLPLPLVDPSSPKHFPITPFDLRKANAVLDAAGWKRGADGVRVKNGVRLTIGMASSAGTPDTDALIEFIRQDWAQIGAEMNVQRYQGSVLFAPMDQGGILVNGKFDVAVIGQTQPAPFDLENLFGCAAFPPAGQNYSRDCDEAIEPLLKQYGVSYDPIERNRLLLQVVTIVNDDVPAITTLGREDIFGLKRAVVNFDPNAATPFDDMMRVDVR